MGGVCNTNFATVTRCNYMPHSIPYSLKNIADTDLAGKYGTIAHISLY